MDGGRSGNVGGVGASPLADIYRRYHARVYRTLACLGVPEPALEDALQDVFIILHRRMGDPGQYRSMIGWIYAVTRRVALHHRRAHARHRRRLDAVRHHPPPVDPDAPDHRLMQREVMALVSEFLQTLDDGQRVVFVLCDLEGLPAPEVADIVGAKVATVYSRLRLARRRFSRIHARLEHEMRRATMEVR